MPRIFTFISIALMTAAIFAAAGTQAADLAIGAKLDSLTLPDTDGKIRTLAEIKGKNGTVVVFLSAQCPVVRGYNERLNAIAADYAAKGINFIGVNSNATEDLERVRSHAAANYKFPVLIDKNNVFADKLGATATPEAYFFNADDVLVYHGAIDDDRTGSNVKTNYLRSAFDAALSGKKVTTAEARAFGCAIKRVE